MHLLGLISAVTPHPKLQYLLWRNSQRCGIKCQLKYPSEPMENAIAGILLAAGKSTRYGEQKLLQPLPDSGIPVALQAANNLLQVLPLSVVVIRENDPSLNELLAFTGIHIFENRFANQGISTSIKAGIQAIDDWLDNTDQLKGYVIALADMPFISPAVIRRVAQGVLENNLICAPHYQGQRGTTPAHET